MNRSAFSLIELIFVMVILGILSSVVLVKTGQMAERAKVTQLKSFVGTLNRSAGPAIWYNSIQNNRAGSIAFAEYDTDIAKYVELHPGYTSGPALVNCNVVGDGIFLSYTLNKSFEVHCADGNTTTSPEFKIYNQTDSLYID